jgi:hypothetical protein
MGSANFLGFLWLIGAGILQSSSESESLMLTVFHWNQFGLYAAQIFSWEGSFGPVP